jgi:hypothetical protein
MHGHHYSYKIIMITQKNDDVKVTESIQTNRITIKSKRTNKKKRD